MSACILEEGTPKGVPLFLLCVWGSIELYHHVSFGVIGKNNRISVRPFRISFPRQDLHNPKKRVVSLLDKRLPFHRQAVKLWGRLVKRLRPNLQFYEFNCRIVDSAEIAVYHPVIIDSIVLAHIQLKSRLICWRKKPTSL